MCAFDVCVCVHLPVVLLSCRSRQGPGRQWAGVLPGGHVHSGEGASSGSAPWGAPMKGNARAYGVCQAQEVDLQGCPLQHADVGVVGAVLGPGPRGRRAALPCPEVLNGLFSKRSVPFYSAVLRSLTPGPKCMTGVIGRRAAVAHFSEPKPE